MDLGENRSWRKRGPKSVKNNSRQVKADGGKKKGTDLSLSRGTQGKREEGVSPLLPLHLKLWCATKEPVLADKEREKDDEKVG